MIGQRIEQIPKNFDYGPHVERLNQVLTYEGINSFIVDQGRLSNASEDPMMVTGLRLTSNAASGASGFPRQPEGPFETTLQQYQGGQLPPGYSKSGGSALKAARRGASQDRDSSAGGDSSSPFPQGGLAGNQFMGGGGPMDGSFRRGANQSK